MCHVVGWLWVCASVSVQHQLPVGAGMGQRPIGMDVCGMYVDHVGGSWFWHECWGLLWSAEGMMLSASQTVQ